MKKFLSLIVILLASAALTQAQTYPTNNPTYVPSAQGQQTSFTAAGDYYFNCNGVGGATLSLEGTFTGLIATVQVTNDPFPISASSTWTAISARPVAFPPIPNVTSLTTAGLYRTSCNGYTGINLHITQVSTGSVAVRIVAVPGDESVHVNFSDGDPCGDPNIPKSSAPIAVSSATTAAAVAAVTGKVIYVCGYQVTYTSGTSPTLLFKYGTQTTNPCDTAATSLTGVMAVPAVAGQGPAVFAPVSLFKAPASNQLCLTSAGTTPNYNGFITYVQQ
jgi:hypothetical protein